MGPDARSIDVSAGRRSPLVKPEERLPLIFLGAATVVIFVLLALAAVVPYEPSPASLGEVTLLAASLAAAAALWSLAIDRGAWRGTVWAARAATGAVAFQFVAWLNRFWDGAPAEGRIASGTMLFLLAIFLAAMVVDFLQHVTTGRLEVLSDAGVVAVLAAGAVFLLQHGQHASAGTTALSAALAVEVIVAFAGWAVLSLWCPSAVHFSLFACATLAGGAAVILDHISRSAASLDTLMAPEVGAALSILALTGILVVEPRLVDSGQAARPPRAVWWVRPILLSLSLMGAFVLVAMALLGRNSKLSVGQSLVLASAMFAAVGIRSLVSQFGMARATTQMGASLREREAALSSLRNATRVVASSEARHRLIVDAAVDGIVELDASGIISRVNDAFCSMVHLPSAEIVGRTWDEMARIAGDSEGSLAALPETGHATVATGTGAAHLEARSSTIPTTPPGTLLLIRDVTASKVAEQTIRTLFQFLQDRDEDRTRLLKRTNVAIEVERNRIARDLHDGPVQGISAAALSLEAVRLMVEQGDFPRAARTLHTLSRELSQEAIGLRQIMSDLRPPVLEQRGLIPAVRDLCTRLQGDMKVPVEVSATSAGEVPSDIETLAYRVVQEALSNVGKHAGASHVWVRIQAGAGMLRVEIQDDGSGFDTERIRDFLHEGKVGLASMRERAELAGGIFTIRSNPGAGTMVLATLPFEVLAAAGEISESEAGAEASA
jgi:PAS domain S-box-containing protein